MLSQLVEALHYKPEGREFDSRRVSEIFRSLNPSGHTLTLGLTQPLTETTTRGLTTLPPSCADCLIILEDSASSWSPQDLCRPVQEQALPLPIFSVCACTHTLP